MLLLLCAVVASLVTGMSATCHESDDTCEFWLEVYHKMTMMYHREAVFAENGKLYKYNVTDTSAATPVDPNMVVVADGWEPQQRVIATVNGTMPGPPIVVYENQTVIVHVTNKMTSNALTIHWHGLHQKGTPWMDGVAFITQCPILPYGTFTYKFKAYPRGTFWYHSHIGTQLSQGVVGAFIIREKNPPMPMDEHIIFLQEWNHALDAELVHMKMEYGGYENRKKVSASRSLEGGHFSLFPFHSGLINGRGRFYHEDGTHTQSPLTVYDVEPGKPYRFRVIGGGSLYPFRLSIDGHSLKVIASDGFDLEPMEVESLILNPGERYDVVLEANQTVGNYWIRAQTLEVNVQNHIAEAILRYQGAPDEEPTTNRKQCSDTDRCMVVNCPYSYYPADQYTDCINLSEMKSTGQEETPGTSQKEQDNIEDIFLNFAFPGFGFTPGAVNGRKFVKPPVSALTQPFDITTQCDPDLCGDEKTCTCTNSITLQKDKVYQMIFLNMGSGKGWAHPIHMHGHSFSVVKMGYPRYDNTTGSLEGDNLDIDCRGNPDREKSFCNEATWANASWGGNNVPGLELVAPPIKDTIIVPTGGYAVVRIRADNPGVWFMHCHIELHNIDGMAIMINESYGDHPAPPTGFPVCGSFESGKRLIGYERYRAEQRMDDSDSDDIEQGTFLAVVLCLIAVIVVLLIVVAYLLRRSNKNTEELRLSNGKDVVYHNKGFSSKETGGVNS